LEKHLERESANTNEGTGATGSNSARGSPRILTAGDEGATGKYGELQEKWSHEWECTIVFVFTGQLRRKRGGDPNSWPGPWLFQLGRSSEVVGGLERGNLRDRGDTSMVRGRGDPEGRKKIPNPGPSRPPRENHGMKKRKELP